MRLGRRSKQIGAIAQQRFDERVKRLKVRAHRTDGRLRVVGQDRIDDFLMLDY